MTLKPESFWRSTLAQTVAGITVIIGCTATVCAFLNRVDTRLARMETHITKAITITEAERYAAEFQWQNRASGLIVPNVNAFRDPAPNWTN